MPKTLIELEARTRAAWRKWLAKHHALSPGVWLVRYKPHTGVTTMAYEDVVREALCFGWIDSLIRRLDEYRYAIKVTPRQPASKWSDLNRRRWAELLAAGQLAWPRSGAHRESLRAPAQDSQAAGVHPRGLPGQRHGVGMLSVALRQGTAELCGLDPHGEAPRDPGEATSREHQTARGGQEARFEVAMRFSKV